MKSCVPHYRLFSVADSENRPGYWRFCFCADDGSVLLDTEDLEPEIRGARLELLTLVRALEALDHPAMITVATGSRYIREGLRFGISEWKRNGWRWECFGRMIPVRNWDLWQRVDRAVAIHQVSCEARSTATDSLPRPLEESPRPVTQPWLPGTQTVNVGGLTPSRHGDNRTNTFQRPLRRWGITVWAFVRRMASNLWWSLPRIPVTTTRLHWR